MNQHLVTLANSFYVGAALLGAPSLLYSFWYGFFRLRLWMAPATSSDSFASVKNPDAFLLILGGIARGIGAAANFLGAVSQGILAMLAVLSAVGLTLALALFLTGRGLHAHAGWARATGGVLMGVLFLVALASLTVFRGPLALVSATVVAASAYAAWMLWRGFAV